MKSQIKGFISGALVSALVLGGAVSALAATGRMTITVYPINIQVNGQTFQPTDVNGKAVPVFAYNGTTYAPLRALAEAYGLTVGYDGEKQMATVTDPDAPAPSTPAPSNDYSTWSAEEEAEYQEWKGMWDIRLEPGYDELTNFDYNKETVKELGDFISDKEIEATYKYALRLCVEMYKQGGRPGGAFSYRNEKIVWLWGVTYRDNTWNVYCNDLDYDTIMQMWHELH